MRTKPVFPSIILLLIFSAALNAQSLYLQTNRSTIGIGSAVSASDGVSAISVGPTFSINKKMDFSIQYSSFTLNDEWESSKKGQGISGSINLWGKKTNIESPLELAMTIMGAYAEYPDFNNLSFGGGIIAAYKKLQPHKVNFIPMVGAFFIPLNQTSVDYYLPTVLNEKFFSFQVGLGIFTQLFQQSKLVVEPSFSLDTNYNFGANVTVMVIL